MNGSKNNDIYKDDGKTFEKCIQSGKPFKYKKNSVSIHIEITTKNFPGNFIKKGDITIGFMLDRSEKTNTGEDDYNLSGPAFMKSNGKSVWDTKVNKISQDTHLSISALKAELVEAIAKNTSDRYINSNVGSKTKHSLEFSLDTFKTYENLQTIIDELNIMLHAQIQIIRKRGRQTKGVLSLKAIVW
jgi:hypothetical protein